MPIPPSHPNRPPSGLPPGVHIRMMQPQDLDQVIAIDKLSFSTPWPESAYRYELFENPLSLLWVAEMEASEGERRVVGAIVVWLILGEAHIATLAVHPDFRGRGISRGLLAAALEESIHRGSRTATLEVRLHNTIAQALYDAFHFEVVGRRPHYYRDNHEDALIMTADLLQLDEQGMSYLQWLESGAWRNGNMGTPRFLQN